MCVQVEAVLFDPVGQVSTLQHLTYTPHTTTFPVDTQKNMSDENSKCKATKTQTHKLQILNNYITNKHEIK